MHLVREGQAVEFLRAPAERNAHRIGLPQLGEHGRLQLRVGGAEIAGVAQRGVGEARVVEVAQERRIAHLARNDSLTGLRDAINAKNSGVTASIVTEAGSARLVLKGATGVANAFTLGGLKPGLEREIVDLGVVRQRHHAVDVGKGGERVGVVLAREVVGDGARHGGRAVDAGQHADVVARGDAAVGKGEPELITEPVRDRFEVHHGTVLLDHCLADGSLPQRAAPAGKIARQPYYRWLADPVANAELSRPAVPTLFSTLTRTTPSSATGSSPT